MDDDLRSRLDSLEKKLDAVYVSAEKSRKYIFWTAVVSIALIVLPAAGIAFLAPQVLSTYDPAALQELLQ